MLVTMLCFTFKKIKCFNLLHNFIDIIYCISFASLTSKIEKVPRGIQGEKSSKDLANSRNLVSTIGTQASPKNEYWAYSVYLIYFHQIHDLIAVVVQELSLCFPYFTTLIIYHCIWWVQICNIHVYALLSCRELRSQWYFGTGWVWSLGWVPWFSCFLRIGSRHNALHRALHLWFLKKFPTPITPQSAIPYFGTGSAGLIE